MLAKCSLDNVEVFIAEVRQMNSNYMLIFPYSRSILCYVEILFTHYTYK